MSEVMRFAFLKDHFLCCVESGLEGQEALTVVRGDREGTRQIERFRVGVDRIWRLVGFVGRGGRGEAPGFQPVPSSGGEWCRWMA